ncbi:MAG: UDP-N-acetylmuramoyl-tripeptide--D-alanyl-D-alanine ligase [Bacteroidota bacterium]
MSIQELYVEFLNANGVCTDTRQIKGGELFFALKGPSFNGNTFAQKAIDLGCSKVVIDDEDFQIEGKTILVENVLATLQQLSSHHRDNLNIPIIGITGSNGKTTTKELLYAVLSKKYATLSTFGNLNNHIGVPLTLLSVKKQHEMAIIEMGANHVGEIAFLCSLAKPNYGLITNIGKAHIGEFGGFDNIIKGKTELYRFIAQNKGLIFINSDDELLMKRRDGIKSVYFGKGQKYNGTIQDAGHHLSIQVSSPWSEQIQTNLYGDYNLSNVLSALAIGDFFNVSNSDMVDAIEEYMPTNNRSQMLTTDRNTLILDAYNANPSSMHAALENFAESEGNKFAILGDMLELGGYTDEEHSKVIALTRKYNIESIFVGEYFKKNASDTNAFLNVEEIISSGILSNLNDRSILIKGSRKIKLERLAEVL